MHSESFLFTLKAFLSHLLVTPLAERPVNAPENGWLSSLKRSVSGTRFSRTCALALARNPNPNPNPKPEP